MKKLILSLTALAMMAFAFTGCEDVPSPYDLPEPSNDTTVVVNPTGSGTAEDPYNVAAALARIDGQNINENSTPFYVKGKISMIKEIDTDQYGNATYYISDDGKYDQAGIGKTQLYIYQSMYLGNTKFTTEDQIKVGDEVVIYGPWVKYQGANSTSTTLETANKGASYIYSLNGKTGEKKESIANTEATAYTVAQAIELVNNGKAGSDSVYVKGIVTSDNISYNSKYNSVTYYISDNGGTDNHLQIYSGRGLNGAAFNSADDIKPGQSVVVYGLLKDYNGRPEIDKENRLISISGGQPATSTGLNATFKDGQDNFTINNVSLGDGATYVWKHDDDNGYMKASAYVNRKNIPCVSQLVSPAFSLEGLSKATLTFQHAERFFGTAADELQVLASTDGKTWTNIPVSAYSDGKGWTFVDATCDLSAFAGQKTVYIAFQYTSTDKHAATWEIKNVVVK